MDVGKPFQTIERAFIDPSFGRIAFLIFVVAGLGIVNYDMGLTHHYDLSSQINQIERMGSMNLDSTQSRRVRSLRTEVINQIEDRQAPLTERIATLLGERILELIVRVISASFLYLLWILYALTAGPGIEQPAQQAIGAAAFAAFLAVVGLLLPAIGDLQGTALVLVVIQFGSLALLLIYGNLRRTTQSQ